MPKTLAAEYQRRKSQKWTRKSNKTPALQLKRNSKLAAQVQRIIDSTNNKIEDLTHAEIAQLVKRRDEEGDAFQICGYKFTDKHAYSLGRRQQFKVGRRYTMTTPVQLCKVGWHFSTKPLHAAHFFQVSRFRQPGRRLFEVRARGKNTQFSRTKVVTGDIEFTREIVGQEYTDLTTGLHQHKDEWGATGFLPKGSKTVFENGNMLFQGPV